MKLLRSKFWSWWEIGLLKWSALVFGMIVGAYIADIVKGNIGWFILVAVILGMSPALTYFKD